MSDRETISVVIGITDYEGSDVVAVFEDEVAAIEHARKCREHERKRPEYPDSDAAVDITRYEKRMKRWLSQHPAGEQSGHSNYHVAEVPFVRKQP